MATRRFQYVNQNPSLLVNLGLTASLRPGEDRRRDPPIYRDATRNFRSRSVFWRVLYISRLWHEISHLNHSVAGCGPNPAIEISCPDAAHNSLRKKFSQGYKLPGASNV
jgi:hypothetical protein